MTPEKRKELLIHEANNPGSLYISNDDYYDGFPKGSKVDIETVLLYCSSKTKNCNWEVYKEPKPDIIDYFSESSNGNLYTYNSFNSFQALIIRYREYPLTIGVYKRIISGETGKVKSIELIPEREWKK